MSQALLRRALSLTGSVRRSPVLWLSAVGVATVFFFSARLHWFFWEHAGPIGFDDGYTMALGERLIDGRWLPYVDGCSHRGPLLYWAAAVAQLVTGRFGWKGARVLSIVTTLWSLFGVYAIGLVVRKPLAGAIGAAVFAWVVFGVLVPSPGFIVTGEGVASPCAVASLLFVALGIHRAAKARPRRLCFAAAGAFAALAGLGKQTALPMIAPIGAWIVASAWIERRDLGECWAVARSCIGGFALVLGVALARYVIAGELGTFWYWYYVYNADIYMAPYKNSKIVDALGSYVNGNHWAVGAFVLSSLVCLARPAPGNVWSAGPLSRHPTVGLERTAAVIALSMFATAVAAQRFWPHYFLVVVPFAALIFGLHAEDIVSRAGSAPTSARSAFFALAVVVGFMGWILGRRHNQFENEARRGQWRKDSPEHVCKVIDSYGKKTDSLFVWGFSGGLYLSCHRHPASRFTYLTLVAGTVPPHWAEVRDDRVAKNARQLLVDDLRKSRPAVVVDAPEPMGKISFTQIPVVREYIRREYCSRSEEKTAHEGTVTLWVRRDLAPCPEH